MRTTPADRTVAPDFAACVSAQLKGPVPADDREERSSDDPSVTAVRSGNRRPLPLTGAWRAAPYRARRQVRGRARRRTGAVRNRACGAPPTAPPAATAQAIGRAHV